MGYALPHNASSIDVVYNDVRNFAFITKKSSYSNSAESNTLSIDTDEIVKAMVEKTAKINLIIEEIDKLTWKDKTADDSFLMDINEIISSAKDLHTSLLKHYSNYKTILKKKIYNKAGSEFKEAIDDLLEACQDLEDIFFHLPNDKEFIEATKKLSLLK